MTFRGIKETCLYVSDLEATREFYAEKLGLEVIGFAEGKHVFFRAGDSVLLCFNPEDSRFKTHIPPHWGQGALHYAFLTTLEEYEGWKQKVEAQGIEIIQEVTWGKEIRSFYFHDPDGHVCEILEDDIW